MKEILIINSSAGVGKDTFVECLKNYVNVYHSSIVNPVKKIANLIGWNGQKTEKDRKFLSDLKKLIDDYNDKNYEAMAELMDTFRTKNTSFDLLCIDMREREQIERARKEYGAKSVLVRRDSVPHIVSNIADAGVFDITYDYYIDNNGTIDELKRNAEKFLIAIAE